MDPLTVKVVMSELNKEVVDLVWGRPSSGGVSASIFRRWTQGNDALPQCDDMNEIVFCRTEKTKNRDLHPCVVRSHLHYLVLLFINRLLARG